MIVGGIVAGAGATVLACMATTKASEIMGEAKEELNCIKKTLDEKPDKYSEEDAKSDRIKVYTRTGLNLAKVYAPAVGLSVASTALVLGGTNVINQRLTASALALSASTIKSKKLHDGILAEFGEEKGKELYNKFIYGYDEEEVKEKIIDENGKTKTVKRSVKLIKDNLKTVDDISYVRVFDWTNPYYCEDDPNYNLFFLRAQQSYFNDKLKAEGYLFMNEVDKTLGFTRTKPGQIVGWHYDENNPNIDNFVDLNITEVEKYDDYGVKRVVCVIEYNVDGSILNDVNWEVEG